MLRLHWRLGRRRIVVPAHHHVRTLRWVTASKSMTLRALRSLAAPSRFFFFFADALKTSPWELGAKPQVFSAPRLPDSRSTRMEDSCGLSALRRDARSTGVEPRASLRSTCDCSRKPGRRIPSSRSPLRISKTTADCLRFTTSADITCRGHASGEPKPPAGVWSHPERSSSNGTAPIVRACNGGSASKSLYLLAIPP